MGRYLKRQFLNKKMKKTSYSIAFIGTAGVPNRYGGFEAFLEFCGPEIAIHAERIIVTCDAALYANRKPDFSCMQRIFLPVRANGAMSILHDLLAFFAVFGSATHIVVLGVSGGPWFPFFRLLCALGGKRLLVNVDGVEWKRTKFSFAKRLLLLCFSALAQRFSHVVIYDNAGLRDYLWNFALTKAVQISYSGDHVIRLPKSKRIREVGTALTICRIVPENNIEMLIEGALRSSLDRYTLVGNWSHSAYGRKLKARYLGDVRLVLLDPIYEAHKLSELRESCDNYLHGHSVGGTNPSLVEMLFYDCKIFCIDMSFHRETAGNCAYYFNDVNTLASLLDTVPDPDIVKRMGRRTEYRREKIAAQYIAAMSNGT
jgi:glycosyltransferase involved in cell wall biosynthesis